MLFSELSIHPILKENIEAIGFIRLTDIQYKAIPNIMHGEDVLAIAQTGTGKTAAYLIPLLDKIARITINKRHDTAPVCLVLVPTHELAQQVAKTCRELAKGLPIKISALYGGKGQEAQIDSLKNNNGIVVATPGRMFDLHAQGHLVLDYIKYLVLDEADKMMFHGFLKDIKDLQTRIPYHRQTLFFSATINREIKKIAYDIINQKAIRIQLSPQDPASKNVNHQFVKVDMDNKRFFLERILLENEGKKTIVFVRTRVRAERVLKAMQRAAIETITLHGEKEQIERESIIEQFEDGSQHILIATDVAARGLDFKDVKIVVNYDIPDQAENYVHRIGRSGRGEKKGYAYSFVSPEEETAWADVLDFLGYSPIEIELSKSEIKETLSFSEIANTSGIDLAQALINEDLKKKDKRKRKR